MRIRDSLLLAIALLALGLVHARPAAATPSLDGCTMLQFHAGEGAFVQAPGVWCMDQDVVADEESNFGLIDVSADDVTIDCRGHALRYASGSVESGIHVVQADRLVIRNCRIEGFGNGISLQAGDGPRMEGNVIEDNVLVGNRNGMFVDGEVLVRRNRIHDSLAVGIGSWGGDIGSIDNLVDGVGPWPNATAMTLSDPARADIRGNTIRRVRFDPEQPANPAYGIVIVDGGSTAHPAVVRDNVLVGDGTASIAFRCVGDTIRYADNVVTGFGTLADGCTDAGDNDVTP